MPAAAIGCWIPPGPVRRLRSLAVLIGGIVEFVPTALIRSNIPTIAAVKPYTPLEIEGATSISGKAAWGATRR